MLRLLGLRWRKPHAHSASRRCPDAAGPRVACLCPRYACGIGWAALRQVWVRVGLTDRFPTARQFPRAGVPARFPSLTAIESWRACRSANSSLCVLTCKQCGLKLSPAPAPARAASARATASLSLSARATRQAGSVPGRDNPARSGLRPIYTASARFLHSRDNLYKNGLRPSRTISMRPRLH